MRNITVIAILVGIIALAGAAFAHGPGMGGWGGHMMAPGYHMDETWGDHMGPAWGAGTNEGYDRPQNRGGFGPGNAWCYGNPDVMRGWNAPPAPETAPGTGE